MSDATRQTRDLAFCGACAPHDMYLSIYVSMHLAGTTPSTEKRMTAVQSSERVSTTSALDDLPDDALKQIFQQLSTEERRAISRTSRKWQRLIAESWNVIDVRLGGTNYLDSASKQIKWLLSLQLKRLACLRLYLKGVELSGIGVDYLLGPLLDMLEQGAFPELTTLYLAADMSLPGSLIHSGLKHLHLDMYALTATIQCPQLQTLHLRTVSMPGPTLFSEETLHQSGFQKLKRMHLEFYVNYLDEPYASWFVLEGLGLLTSLQHLVLDFPLSIDIDLSKVPVLPVDLTYLELHCGKMHESDLIFEFFKLNHFWHDFLSCSRSRLTLSKV